MQSPLVRPKWTQMQSVSDNRLRISWWDFSRLNLSLRIRPLAVALKPSQTRHPEKLEQESYVWVGAWICVVLIPNLGDSEPATTSAP